MKSLIVAASVLILSTGAAFAGEGGGNPFPFAAATAAVADVPTTVIQQTGQTPTMSKLSPNSAPYSPAATAAQMRQYATVAITQGDVLPSVGSQSEVETANSLPAGFENGTVPYMQAQSVARYFAQQAQSPRAYAQSPQPGQVRTGG